MVIPNSVTSIGESAFSGYSGLTSVTIPNSVTSIGSYAFSGCSGLKSVTIPNSVTSIGSGAFEYGSGLTSVTIGSVVTSIGSGAFWGCSGLTSVSIPNSVTSIGYGAFWGCSGLTSVTIPNSITSINDYAFGNCSNLTKVTLNSNSIVSKTYTSSNNIGTIFGSQVKEYVLGDNITTIGNGAFSGCDNLTSIIIDKNNPKYDSRNNCNAIIETESNTLIAGCQNTIIPNSVTSIGRYAFKNCTGLTSVTIPNSITSIGDYAFEECSGLTSVTFGTGLLSIGNNAFGNTKPTKVIWLTNTPPSGYSSAAGIVNYVANNQYASLSNTIVYPFLSSMFEVDGVRYVPVSPSERTCDAIDCSYSNEAENIVIGKTVSFKGIDMTVRSINQYTCYQNPYIKNIDLSTNCAVSDASFYGCSGVKTIILNNLGDIGSDAFYQSTGLKSLEIGGNVKNIGSKAFAGCIALQTATIQSTGTIDYYAFNGCAALTAATLGKNITGIGSYAFQGCSSLQDIIIHDAVTSLGSCAFSGCSSLENVHIGSGVTSIGNYAFSGCKALPAIEIPGSVTSIGNYTFSGCTSLKTVIMDGQESVLALGSNGSSPLFSSCPLDSVYIDRPVTYPTSGNYGYSPFYRNTSLRSIHITDKLTEISDNEFYGCTKLYSVYIGNGVQSIGDYAFSGCSSIDYFSFGNQVQTIGAEAFSDCVAMTRLYSYCQVPPTCGASALADIDKWNCTLYIPKGTASTYAAANQWMDFFFIEENEEGGEGIQYTISVDFDATKGTVTGAGVYNIGTEGILIATPAEGCTFVAWEDGSTNPERHIYAYKSETYTATFSAPNYELYNGNDIAVTGESVLNNIEIDQVSYPNAIAYSYSTTTDINLPDNICGQNNEGDWYADSIALIDAQPFYAPYDVEAKHLSYARTFENDQWQALYVPFDMQYADFSSKVRIAYVNNVHQYDDDDNGVIDRTVIEFISVVNDDIKANWPYIVKPNTAGAMTFNVANTTLHATEDNDVECQSAFTRFNIIGTYQNTPIINKYIVHNSEFELCESLQTVSPFRIYLVVTNKYPTSPQPAPMRVTFMIDGREEPAPTGVEMLYENDSTGETYDVLGRPVSHPSHGIFIRNGEKILVK